MTSADSFFRGSQVYDPVALLRQGDETLYVARVGRRTSRRFMILTPTGDPAWPHEPLGSLSDVAWALRAHEWHLVAPEPMGESTQQARMLARQLTERSTDLRRLRSEVEAGQEALRTREAALEDLLAAAPATD